MTMTASDSISALEARLAATEGRLRDAETRLAATEQRLAVAEARIAALELRGAGYPVQPLPGVAPGQPYNPAPGWPWYEVTCGGSTVQSDTAPAVTIKPLWPAS